MNILNIIAKAGMALVVATLSFPVLAEPEVAGTSDSAIKPNGKYSLVGVTLGRTNYATDKCILGECHPGYGTFGFNVSYQLIPNMIIGLRSQGGLDSMKNTSIRESQGGVYLGFVMGVGDSLDIGGLINPLNKHYESCLGSLCSTADESGNNVEFFGKWWINEDKTFHLGLTLDNYAYANGSTNPNGATSYHSTGLSAGYLLGGHHEFSLSGSRLKDVNGNDVSATGNIGYNYHF
jgi:hypothetical protein